MMQSFKLQRRILWQLGWVMVFMISGMSVVSAQTAPTDIFEDTGVLDNASDPVDYELLGLAVGDVVYATLEASSGNLDTYLLLSRQADNGVVSESDDIYFENTNSALVYRVSEAGDYILSASRYDDSSDGEYVIRYSVNNPEVFPNLGENRAVQEETGTVISEEDYVFYDLFDVKAGDTIYAYVEATDDQLDSYIFFGNINFDVIYAENDDIAVGITNSALFYTVPEDGDYTIAVTAYDNTTVGDYRILIGVNVPQVLSGLADETEGTSIAVAGSSEEVSEFVRPRVQQFRGEITEANNRQYYDLFDMKAGDILYVYVETIDGTLDTYAAIGDIDFTETYMDNDDIDFAAGNLNSAFQYEIPADGDYSVAVRSAVDGTSGTYRLLIGLGAPDVLAGTASPTNDLIAQLFVGGAGTSGLNITDCSVLYERPVLSGPVQTVENERFIIHYTIQGVDGATPSMAQAIADAMAESWEIQIEQLGWPIPPSDCGEGGDTRYDVYVMETESQNALGFAQAEGLVGDNPGSAEVETYAAYSYMVMDNNYANAADPLATMRATAAHEFHHGVQYGFDLNDGSRWVYEATATWMETITYPRDQDATPYIPDLLASPGLCVGNVSNDESGLRIYAEWALMESIASDFGDEAIAKLWRNIANYENMEAFYNLLFELGTTSEEVIINYAVRNLLGDYELSDLFYSTVAIATRVNGDGRVISRGIGVQELGVNYVRVMVNGLYTFSTPEENLVLYYVGINGDEAQIYPLGRAGAIDTSAFSQSYIIIFNTTEHADAAVCNATRWTLDVKEGGDVVVADYVAWNASKFRTPVE